MKTKIGVFLLALTFAVVTMPQAEEMQEKGSMTDPNMEAMMAKYAEYATPGEQHDALNVFIGQWHATVKHWMSPESEPEVSEGTSEAKWILNGRFVQQTYKGEAMGQLFEGLGLIGYDNLMKKYNTIWLDSMGTGMMKGTGSFDIASKTMSDQGSFSCPFIGGNRGYRSVTTIIDEDHYKYETYMDDGAGNEFQAVLITYSRQGADELAGNIEAK